MVGSKRFNDESTLSWSWSAGFLRKNKKIEVTEKNFNFFARGRMESEAFKSGKGEDDGIEFTIDEFGDSCGDIAS